MTRLDPRSLPRHVLSASRPPRRRSALLALSLASLAVLAGCSHSLLGVTEGVSSEYSPIPVLQPADEPITVDNRRFSTRETKLGASQHPQIVATYGGLYSDPKLERTVARIVGRLTEASPESTETYRVFLLDSASVNAFALPGGYLYITRGLLALADDSAELAAVIAHEMAHVIADHGLERQRRVERSGVAERVAQRVMPAAERRRALTRDKLDAAQFSRIQEMQADEIGTKMMARAGYDPRAAVDFLRSMERYTRYRAKVEGTEGGPSLDFLASHPAAPQRLKKLDALASSLRGTGAARERERYLAGIDGMLFGDGSDLGYVRGRSFAHPRLGIAFDVPEGYTLENSAEALLATGPGDVAVRFDSVAAADVSIRTSDPVEYLKSGWVAGLAEKTVAPITIAGLPAARGRAFAGGYAFDVTVVRSANRFDRFLTAAPPTVGDLERRAAAITATYRLLGEAERAALKPLRLVIRPNAKPSSMRGVERAGELFDVLNHSVAAGKALGAKRKLVTDGR